MALTVAQIMATPPNENWWMDKSPYPELEKLISEHAATISEEDRPLFYMLMFYRLLTGNDYTE